MLVAIAIGLAIQASPPDEASLLASYRQCTTQAAFFTAQSSAPARDAAELALTICQDQRALVLKNFAVSAGEGAAAQRVVMIEREMVNELEGPIIRARLCASDPNCHRFFDQRGIVRLTTFAD